MHSQAQKFQEIQLRQMRATVKRQVPRQRFSLFMYSHDPNQSLESMSFIRVRKVGLLRQHGAHLCPSEGTLGLDEIPSCIIASIPKSDSAVPIGAPQAPSAIAALLPVFAYPFVESREQPNHEPIVIKQFLGCWK